MQRTKTELSIPITPRNPSYKTCPIYRIHIECMFIQETMVFSSERSLWLSRMLSLARQLFQCRAVPIQLSYNKKCENFKHFKGSYSSSSRLLRSFIILQYRKWELATWHNCGCFFFPEDMNCSYERRAETVSERSSLLGASTTNRQSVSIVSRTVICILLTELCIELTFQGIVGNLQLFATDENQLNLSPQMASTITYIFQGILYYLKSKRRRCSNEAKSLPTKKRYYIYPTAPTGNRT